MQQLFRKSLPFFVHKLVGKTSQPTVHRQFHGERVGLPEPVVHCIRGEGEWAQLDRVRLAGQASSTGENRHDAGG